MHLFEMSDTILWFCLLIGFGVLEAITVGLVSIWFAGGALAAMLISFVVPSFGVQVGVFVVVSAVALVATRPLLAKFAPKAVPTNAGRNLGRTATVIAEITPERPGRVKLDGVDWAARAEETLQPGELCEVRAIDSTTLFVKKPL